MIGAVLPRHPSSAVARPHRSPALRRAPSARIHQAGEAPQETPARVGAVGARLWRLHRGDEARRVVAASARVRGGGEALPRRDRRSRLGSSARLDVRGDRVEGDGARHHRAHYIRRTVDNFRELRSIAPDLPIVPVLQGFALDDYRRCADEYDRGGVSLEREPIVGLGSVCRRSGTEEAVGIVLGVLQHVPGVRLHGFGFKIEGLDIARSALASADSLAWSFRGRHVHDADHPHERGARSCANCMTFALAWRESLLSRRVRAVQGRLL